MGFQHQNRVGKNDEWLTPLHIVRALGPFDLDPCAPVRRPWDTAARHFTREDDGLTRGWSGRVWMNPPYGPDLGDWLGRLRAHGDGVALVPARTETQAFFEHVWGQAHGILFVRGRVRFHYVDGTPAESYLNAPVVLLAYGRPNVEALRASGLGYAAELRRRVKIKPDPFGIRT